MMAGREQGDASVFEGVRCAVGLASRALPLALAVVLCGCSYFDTSGSWFVKPLRLYGSNLGYTYTQLDDAKMDRPITANDLVDASGACPRYVVPSPPPAAGAAPAAGPTDSASLLGAGVAIGMSECDIVARLGQPTAVNVGRGPGGDRAAALTFNSGPRPGVYRFAGGRLTEMDRVEVPQAHAPEPAKKKMVKKRPDKTKKPPRPDNNT
ncbi:MAG: hypothetical protein WBD95_23365 [Xanthobacteraceae bacterium]